MAKAKTKTKTKTKAASRPARPKARVAKAKQKFVVTHFDPKAFKRNGLRGHADYRDLGMAEATGGMVQAHVIHLNPSVDLADVKSTPHFHKVKFQMVYCLRGWMTFEFEGHGRHTMRAGSCWMQPAGIKHWIVDRSADYEVLEIIMPAKYETVLA